VDGAYQGEFVAELTQTCPETIYILTNNERRVYVEFGETRRTFDHVWRTTNGLIFKGLYPLFLFLLQPTSFQISAEGSRAKPLSKGPSLALLIPGLAWILRILHAKRVR